MKKQRYAFAFIIAVLMGISAVSQAGTISGSISYSNGQSSGAVQIFNSSGNYQGDFWTDGNGDFSTGNLPDDSYFAMTKYTNGVIDDRWDGINGSQCLNNLCDVLAGTPIVISGGNVTGINFVLDPITSGGTISGHAQDASNNPLSNLTIAIFDSNGDYLREMRTDPFGNYQSPLMGDDTYYIRTHNNEPLGMSRQAYNSYNCIPVNNCNNAALVTNATAIVVTGSDVANIDFNLSVPATGSIISGNVADEGINQPLPRTRMILLNGAGSWLADTETDNLGNYYFSGLADGDYKVYVESPPQGYSGELYNNIPCPNWSCDMANQGTVITVAGADVVSIDIGLTYTGTRLFGTVTRSDTSQPVSAEYRYFAVKVFDSSGNYMFESATNDAGQYQLNLQAAGDYYLVTAQDQGYHGLYNEGWNNIQCTNNCADPIGMGATLITVAAGTTVVKDFILDPTPFISGTVTAQNGGTLLADIEVCVTRRDGNWIGCTRTDINGNYKMVGLPAEADLIPFVSSTSNQPYQLETYINQAPYDWTNGTGIDVSTASVTGIDFGLEDGFFISGTVLEAGTGNPVVGVNICMHRTDGSYAGICRGSEAGGVFQIPALPAGTDYVAYVVGDQQGYKHQMWNSMACPFKNCDFSQGTPITLGPGHASGIDFNLSPVLGISIQGRVTDSATGLPIQGVQVEIQNSSGYLTSAQSDANGDYSIPMDANGDFIVVIPTWTLANTNYLPEVWPNVYCNISSCDFLTEGTPVNVNGSDVTGIDFALESGNTISGTVLDGASNPVVGLAVCIHRLDGSFTGSCGDTDASGNYQAYQLPAGNDYVAYTVSESFGLIRQMWNGVICPNDSCDFSAGTPITLGAGNVSNIDFGLYVGANISGTVTDLNGAIEGVTVTAQVAGGVSYSATTDAAGVYNIGKLPMGDYYMMAAIGSHFNQVYPNMDCVVNCDPVSNGTPVNAPTNSSNVTGINFVLDPGSSISGVVSDEATGDPIEGTILYIYLQNGTYLKQTVTDISGSYKLGGLTNGAYYLVTRTRFDMHLDTWYGGEVCQLLQKCISDGSGIPIVVPNDSSVVNNIDFPLGIGGAITGQILLEDGSQFNNAWGSLRAEIWDENENLIRSDTSIEHWNGETSYDVLGLAPGTYYVIFNSTTKFTSWSQFTTRQNQALVDTAYGGLTCPRGSCDLSLTVPVTVSSGQTVSGIDGMLPWGPIMKGTLSNAVNGDPIDGLVFLHDSDGDYAGFGQKDNVTGEWQTFTSLPAGTYYLSTFSHKRNNLGLYGFRGLNFVDELYNDIECAGGCEVTLGQPITVTNAVITGLDIQVVPGGTISGNVSDVNGALPLVTVVFYDSLGDKVGQAVTDLVGDYSMPALPVGNYYAVTDNSSGLLDEVHTPAGDVLCEPFCNPLIGTAVNMPSIGGTVNAINFVLAAAGEISGTVLDAGGVVIGGIQVEVYNAIGSLVASSLSDATGAFVIQNLAGGDYYVRTNNSANLVDVLYQGLTCIGNACDVTNGTIISVTPGNTASTGNLQLQAQLTLGGRLTDTSTAAIIGTNVALHDAAGNFVANSVTDSNGNYTHNGLLAGDYYVVTRGTPGYIDEAYNNVVCSASCPATTGAPVVLTASLANIDFVLSAGTVISGNVSSNGSGVIAVRVQVYDSAGLPFAENLTDINGDYSIPQIPDGTFYVRTSNDTGFVDQVHSGFTCEGFCNVSSGTSVIVNGSPVTINFNLAAGGAISGNITDGVNGVSSIPLQIFDTSENLVGTAITDANGDYQVSGLVAGSYSIKTIATNGYINEVYGNNTCSPEPCLLANATMVAVANSTVIGIDFALNFGQSFAGTATDTFNNPLPTGTAVLYDSVGTSEPIMETPITFGIWQFNGVANGDYYLLILNGVGLVDELYSNQACPGGSCDIATLGTIISLSSATVASSNNALSFSSLGSQNFNAANSLDIVLDQGVGVSGFVRRNTASPIAVEGATVFVMDPVGKVAGSGVSDGLGDYVIESSFPPGNYLVTAMTNNQSGINTGLINELYGDIPCPLNCDLSAGATVTLVNGVDQVVDFVLDGGASISGSAIVSGANISLANATVQVYSSSGYLVGEALVGFDDAFNIFGLPAGDYYAILKPVSDFDDTLYGGQVCVSGCDVTLGTRITLTSQQVVIGIDFLIPASDDIFMSGFEN